ncbi:hypothetical protein RF11_09387 [Thelohanellus kitauei]|uniref:Uncharacterized protein n=1 Tax=Thelohanellus kitauei TaxID=669202 RepID=A0A0C2M4S7_THEKT|nr:hypothetical protein RF11_09387 [Thelohanellus kitauei]
MEIEELIKDPENAEMYYCPRRSTKNCLCLEEFVMRHIWMNVNLGTCENALKLLKGLRRNALELSKERCTMNDVKNLNDECMSNFQGYKNRKSKKYVEYIVKTRRKLRLHGICEVATKKMLKYSDRILRYKLKYDYEKRNDLIADETCKSNRNKNYIPIEDLKEVRCCKNKCTNKLKNNVTFYSQLRSDATISQKMKRKVITKLLMTTSGEDQNCIKFIVLLLGVSRTTICSVKNFLSLGSKGEENQESKQTDKKLAAYTQNLEKTMPIQTSNTHHQTTDAVNNFQQVNPTPQDMWQTSVSLQNNVVPTTQTQQMFYPANSFTEFNPNGNSLFQPEQFQTTMPMNQNISMPGYPNVANVCQQFYVPNEGVASASHNPNINYIAYIRQNAGNNIFSNYNNNLHPQQNISINQMNNNMVNDFSHLNFPTYPANMNRMYIINPIPQFNLNAVPVTTPTSRSFG